jgi:hypothetical protein
MDELADGFSDSVFPLAFVGKLSDGRYLVLCLFAGPFHYLSDNGEKRFAPAGFASFLIFVSSDCVGRCVIGTGSFSLGKSVGRGCILLAVVSLVKKAASDTPGYHTSEGICRKYHLRTPAEQ